MVSPMPIPKHRTAVIASAVGLSLGGGAIATAASQPGATATPAPTATTPPPAGGHDHGPGGHGGPGHHLDAAALAKALGVTEAKLQTALDAVRPDKDDHDARRTEETAAIAQALGASAADVQAVLDANRPDPQQRPDRSALAKALAAKLNVTEAKAQAALDAAHGAHGPKDEDKAGRGDALAAALAKELGLDAAKVKAALAAQKPARP
jgi:hypothetical protein